jgi:hypothetical protein
VFKGNLDHNLKAKTTALRHHNAIYYIGTGVFVFLMLIVYSPLGILMFKIAKALFCNDIAALKELIGVFAQKELGMAVAVLCVIPIYLLSTLLKYNRIDTSQDTEEGDNLFTPYIFPR